MSSRQKDLAHVEEQIRALTMEAQKIQQAYQGYHAEVQASVKEIMEAAGVWNEVHSLEQERSEAGKRAEEKIRGLSTQIQDLQKVRAFLLGREEADVPKEPVVPDAEPPLLVEEEEEEDEGGDEGGDGPEVTEVPEVMEGVLSMKRPRPPTL